jgi:uncharacterized oligopeptide transporter (OPT) family protein
LPLSTTLPIAIGGAIRGLVDKQSTVTNKSSEEEELGRGNLFATGLVAGGAVAGVIIAFLSGTDSGEHFLNNISLEESLSVMLSTNGYYLFGTLFFAAMGYMLYKVGLSKSTDS